jgi:hypothetical protein
MRATTVLASDLVPGDLLLESGIGGVSGLVTRVHVAPEYVAVWILGEPLPHSLGIFESCTIERELRAEAA